MIDIRKLKELVRLMVENDLTEIDLQDQEETVTVKRGSDNSPIFHTAPTPAPPVTTPTPAPSGGNSTPTSAPADDGLVPVESPMVGTFYTAPDPDSPPFVKQGESITPDTTVCLIEAMKVFNEIKAETSGTIEKVLVESGTAVEFGQKLFLVRPS